MVLKRSLSTPATGTKVMDSLCTDAWWLPPVQYFEQLNARLLDTESVDLTALAQWGTSPLREFRISKVVLDGLEGMMKKVKVAGAWAERGWEAILAGHPFVGFRFPG